MILYTLKCAHGHKFEAWFRDSASYDEQAGQGGVECPQCGSTEVSKAIMAPHIGSGARDVAVRETDADGPSVEQLTAFVTALKETVEANADYVGDRFADEARRIHYGETEERAIYGEASTDEAKDLAEEGVAVLPLPFRTKSDG